MNQPASIAQMANALVNAFGAYTHRVAVREVKVSGERLAVSGDSVQNNQNIPSTPNIPNTPKTFYAIQVRASKTALAANDPDLKGLRCDTVHAGEWIKYYTAADEDRSKVAAQLPEIKKLFPDCWIIKVTK